MGVISNAMRKLASKTGIAWLPGRHSEAAEDGDPGCIHRGKAQSHFDPARVCNCPNRVRPPVEAEANLPRSPCGCVNTGYHEHMNHPHYPRRRCGCYVNTAHPAQGDAESEDCSFSSSPTSSGSEERGYRTLSPAEFVSVLQGVGAQDPHKHGKAANPTNSFWPPKGMPRGLYRDVLEQKTKYMYFYYGTSTLQWLGVITQIILGAILALKSNRAFGSRGGAESDAIFAPKFPVPQPEHRSPDGPAEDPSGMSGGIYAKLTGLVIANTINAALVAVLRGMGFISRYNRMKNEFGRVENDIRRVIDTGVVDEELEDANEVVYQLYKEYNKAYGRVSKMPPPIPIHRPHKMD